MAAVSSIFMDKTDGPSGITIVHRKVVCLVVVFGCEHRTEMIYVALLGMCTVDVG